MCRPERQKRAGDDYLIHHWLDSISIAMQNNYFAAPALALLAGIISSMSPCSLSNIPLIVGLTGSKPEKNNKNPFLISLIFVLGTTLTFVVLGLVASLLGQLVNTESARWSIVIGTIMCMMALQIWGVANFIPHKLRTAHADQQGYSGAFMTGMLGGILSSPCATPILLILLGIAAQTGNLFWGGLLLLMFSFGHGILVLLAGISAGFIQKIQESKRYHKISNLLNKAMGLVLLYIGLNMLFLRF